MLPVDVCVTIIYWSFLLILPLTQVAWAPGVGIKESAFRKLCNIELGVTYIPWERVPDNLDPLLDGGVLDEDSVPQDFAGRTCC